MKLVPRHDPSLCAPIPLLKQANNVTFSTQHKILPLGRGFGNMQFLSVGKLSPDFGDVLKVVLNLMSATWEKILDNIVQVSTNWEEKSFTAFQKPNQHSWLLKSHFCWLLGWLLGFKLHS
jgi:hypothetical protein